MNVADIPASVVVTNTSASTVVVEGLTFLPSTPRTLLLSPMADEYKLTVWNGMYAAGLSGVPALFYVDPDAYAGPVPPVVAPGGTTGTIPVNEVPAIEVTSRNVAFGLAGLDDGAHLPAAQIGGDANIAAIKTTLAIPSVGVANGAAGLNSDAVLPASQFGGSSANVSSLRKILGLVVGADGEMETEDFLDRLTSARLGLSNSSNGGSSTTAVAPTSGVNRGITSLMTNATAVADQRGGITTNLSSFKMGDGVINLFSFTVAPSTVLFSAGLPGRYHLGLANVISTQGNDVVEFRSVDGGNWFAVTRLSGVETATDLGFAPVLNVFETLTFVVNATNTSVAFYRGPTLVATHTTNIPTIAVGVRATCHRVSATGTNVILNIDRLTIGRRFASDQHPTV